MKTRMFWIMGLALMIVMACGKSADQKKAEADLNTDVMKLHDDLMTMQKDLDGLDGQLDAALAKHNELAKDKANIKKMGDHIADDITAAKGLTAAAKEGMGNWMKGFKKYDPSKPHEEVMKQLKADKDALTKVKTDMEGASAASRKAIDDHAKFAESLTAKKVKK
jgi:hypothetical protein